MVLVIRWVVHGEIIHLSSSKLDKSLLLDYSDQIHSIQVNILATDSAIKPKSFCHSSKTTIFHYIVGSDTNIEDMACRFFSKLNIDHKACLLSKRELSVLKALNCIASTKQAADKLHISDRTLNNHRYNISKKTGMNALDAADLLYRTDNIRLVLAILNVS